MANDELSVEAVRAAIGEKGGLWTAGKTALSDLTPEELLLRMGYVPGPGEMSLTERMETAKAARMNIRAVRSVSAPAAFDLRNAGGRNFVTAVRDQRNCGSCVAFGTLAAIEATVRFRRNDPNLARDLSEAQVFYCFGRNVGRRCDNGWWVSPALDAIQSQGVADENCYPYIAGDQDCSGLCGDWEQRTTRITGHREIRDVNEMKDWLSSKGALVACFTVFQDFASYTGGVYRHVTGAQRGGHCISVVGYDDASQCWLCKNSWGSGWGEAGFFRIGYGECGIDASMWGVEVLGGVPAAAGALYRYWNPDIGDHFYTTNWGELGDGAYGWGFEGIQCFVAATQVPGTLPLYRYWNPDIGDHFYTTNWEELREGNYGWGLEGVQCFVWANQQAGTVPLFRYWNPGAGDHFYTTSWEELGEGNYGWGYEGVQCYVATSAAGGPASAQGGFNSHLAIPATFRAGKSSQGSSRPATFHTWSGQQPPPSFTPKSPFSKSSFLTKVKLDDSAGGSVTVNVGAPRKGCKECG